MEINATVEFKLVCDKCKGDLEATEQYRHGLLNIFVEPCQDCLQAEYEKGQEE